MWGGWCPNACSSFGDWTLHDHLWWPAWNSSLVFHHFWCDSLWSCDCPCQACWNVRGIPDANMVSLGIEHMTYAWSWTDHHNSCSLPFAGPNHRPCDHIKGMWATPYNARWGPWWNCTGTQPRERGHDLPWFCQWNWADCHLVATMCWTCPGQNWLWHWSVLYAWKPVSAAPLLGLESQPVCFKYPWSWTIVGFAPPVLHRQWQTAPADAAAATSWADDEIWFHLHAGPRPEVVVLDPLVASAWIADQNFPCERWAENIRKPLLGPDQTRAVIGVFHADHRWIPVYMAPTGLSLNIHTWDSPSNDHEKLKALLERIGI